LLQRQRVAAFQSQKLAAETKPDILLGGKPGKETTDTAKEVLNLIGQIIEKEEIRGMAFMLIQEQTEAGWVKDKDIVEQVRDEIDRLERETNEWGEVTIAQQELIEAGWERQKKQLELQRQMTEVDIGRQIANIQLERSRLSITKEDALKKEIDLQKQILSIYEEQIFKIDKLQDPAGYMALYTAIDGVRSRLNNLNVELETTTGTAFQGFVRGVKEYADQIKSTFELTRDASKSVLSEMQTGLKSFLSDAMRGELKSWKDYLKRICDSVVDIWADMVSKMIMKWIFGQQEMQSGSTSGAGKAPGWSSWINLIGGLLGSVGKMFSPAPSTAPIPVPGTPSSYYAQHGAQFWALRPTQLLVGEGGEPELVTVIPKSKMAANQSISVGPISVSIGKDRMTESKMRDEIERAVVAVVKRYS
jgi:hypothetical protein